MSSFSAAFLDGCGNPNVDVHCCIIQVVATRLCSVLSSEASDVLQCTGERLSDGQFIFTMVYDVKADIHDCETQWLNDENVCNSPRVQHSTSKDRYRPCNGGLRLRSAPGAWLLFAVILLIIGISITVVTLTLSG